MIKKIDKVFKCNCFFIYKYIENSELLVFFNWCFFYNKDKIIMWFIFLYISNLFIKYKCVIIGLILFIYIKWIL